MFNNAGEKLKSVANILTLIGFIASIIGGFVVWFSELETLGFFLGLLVIAGGIFSSWLSGLVLYCIGEAADSGCRAAYHTTPSNSYPTTPSLTPNHITKTTTKDGKQCPLCGKSVSDHDITCNYCGEKLN